MQRSIALKWQRYYCGLLLNPINLSGNIIVEALVLTTTRISVRNILAYGVLLHNSPARSRKKNYGPYVKRQNADILFGRSLAPFHTTAATTISPI